MSNAPLKVRRKDLPLSCPDHRHSRWDFHPRVFLPIEKTGKITCPYCNQEYILIED